MIKVQFTYGLFIISFDIFILDSPMVGCRTSLFGNEYCESCQFPFTYNGETFYNCTRTGYHLSWCSTKTFSNFEHMTGFWGACTYDPNAVRPFTTNAPTNFTIPVIGNVTNNAFGNYTIQDLPIPVIGNFTNTVFGNHTIQDFLGNSSRYDYE